MNDYAYLVTWAGLEDLRVMTREHVKAGWIPDGDPTPSAAGGLQQKLRRPSQVSTSPDTRTGEHIEREA